MSKARYYEDLSGDSSTGANDDSSDDDSESFLVQQQQQQPCDRIDSTKDHVRYILHADVDCFYCQCESIDRKISPDRPFAIGQKHIIVTCNYEARKYGVSKLERRDTALQKCPHLLILEGSDLERYRVYARKIYDSFRKACKIRKGVSVCKGSMDEMMADISEMIRHDGLLETDLSIPSSSAMYVYGDQEDEQTVLTEDQTGATSIIRGDAPQPGDNAEDLLTKQSLLRLSQWVCQIRRQVLQETGFTITMGLSVNPLLAKLASGLRKPATVNILYPWRAETLVRNMPIRKIPGVGRRTMKVLESCLQAHHGNTSVWLCRHLLKVPRLHIQKSLEKLRHEKTSDISVDVLLNKCVGFDNSPVVDDEGGLPKTVSVENSFPRGSVCDMPSVRNAVEDLYTRLPKLMKNRASWSHDLSKSQPTTLRVTVRSVVSKDLSLMVSKKRPFETHSKQVPFDGISFVNKNTSQQSDLLRMAVPPLLASLVHQKNEFNITRINIALLGFGDAVVRSQPETSSSLKVSRQKVHTLSHSELKHKRSEVLLNERVAIDSTVLAELPSDIPAEVQSISPQQSFKKTRIDHFFLPRR